jgi:RND family efflux transporter MFP subunit
LRQPINFVPPVAWAAALLLSGCERPVMDPRTQPPLVSVVDVAGEGAEGRAFTGVVRARVESDLGFRVGGKIIERLVDTGQSVRRGQAIMRLDPVDLRLGVEAQVSAVAAARARALQADADLKRLAGLIEQGAISAQAYDEAKAAAESADAQLAAAQAQARLAGNASAYAVLVADADGVIEQILAEPGQVVAAGQAVARLAHAGPREAAADLPETVRPALGSTASATLYETPGQVFPARLRQLSQSADPATRTFEARYVLGGAAASAPLGATVTLRLATSSADGAADVPLGAIYDPGSGPGVWRVVGTTVRFQPVRLAGLGPETARVVGLAAGSRIVGLGAERLREGEAIRPAPMPGRAVESASLAASAAPSIGGTAQ